MTKIEKSQELIAAGVKAFPRGMVAWSGGKDSMVLLHLMREMGIHYPIIFFREPWQPQKYVFHDELIRNWELLVYSWHPTESSFQQTENEFEVQNLYRINSTTMTCPTGIVEPVIDLPWACAIDILHRPKQVMLEILDFDCIWVGHKGCDSDPILGGDAGTRIEARILPTMANMMFPLRDWTHDDVWEYIESNNIPFDHHRYEKVDGKWGEKKDKRHNMDYVHACTRCVDRRPEADKYVTCPKIGMVIENISSMVPWASQEKLTYMKD
jgi:hypothetical protein